MSNDQLSGWEHLKPYGYAPGHYLNTCISCRHVTTGLDKRAHVCRPCAEVLHARDQLNPLPEPQPRPGPDRLCAQLVEPKNDQSDWTPYAHACARLARRIRSGGST
jgi:hypothetical protein